MLKGLTVLKSICWLFITSVLISTVQISIAGFQSDDGSWFNYMINVMAEEETEDTENEEKTKKTEWFSEKVCIPEISTAFSLYSNPFNRFYTYIFREVFSPPPEL